MKLKTTRTFYSGLHGFGMEVPMNWTTQNSALASTLVKFVYRENVHRVSVLSVSLFRKGSLAPTDAFSPLKSEERRANPTIALAPEDMFSMLKVEHPGAVSLATGTAKIKNFDAVWNVIEVTEPADSCIVGKFYHFYRDGELWRFAATTDCGREFFDAMLPSMEQAIETAKFEKPEI